MSASLSPKSPGEDLLCEKCCSMDIKKFSFKEGDLNVRALFCGRCGHKGEACGNPENLAGTGFATWDDKRFLHKDKAKARPAPEDAEEQAPAKKHAPNPSAFIDYLTSDTELERYYVPADRLTQRQHAALEMVNGMDLSQQDDYSSDEDEEEDEDDKAPTDTHFKNEGVALRLVDEQLLRLEFKVSSKPFPCPLGTIAYFFSNLPH